MLPSLRTCLVLPAILFTAITSLVAQPGTLFSSFGINGLLTDPSRQTFEKAITSQPDKKILIGSQGFYQGFQTFLIDRLLPDGSKDSSFGTNGTAYALFQSHNNTGNISSEINAIALLPDGKIIAAGHADGNGKNIAIARFLSNGTPDVSFGKNGTSVTGFNVDDVLTGIAVQPDGKLVICGASSPDFIGNNRFFIARYLSAGTVDSSFGNGGIVLSSYTGSANAVLVQPGGKIIAGGYSTGTEGISFHVECYDANGSYNNSFGTNGITDSRINGGFLSFINDVVLQSDGKLVAAGRSNGGGTQTFTLVRYNSNGSFDNSFGTNGIVTTPFTGATGEAEKVMLTAKGDYLIATGSRNKAGSGDFVIASYTLTGMPDTAFGDGGIVITDFRGSDFNNSATLCADGSIVALGNTTGQYPFAVRALAKYNGYPVSERLFVWVKRWLQNHSVSWQGLPATDKIASYKVEQSRDGKAGFTEIASVSGASQLKEYNLTNSHLLAGENYYRVKAVNLDGSVKYSETVRADNLISTVSVYPNPAKDVVVIKGLNAEGPSYISITNSGGKVVMKAVSNSNPQHLMTVSSLQKGTYYITVIRPDKNVETAMFVKE